MSDHEGFEMLDETFGVRSESSSQPNSPQPTSSSLSSLQLQQHGDGSTANDDVLHFGRVEMETGDTSQNPMVHAPSDSMMAISPQQTGKGCGNGAGTVTENDALLKSGIDAGWDRFRPTDRAEQQSLVEPSAPKDPRSRSPAKIDRDGNRFSTINAKPAREGHVGASLFESSSTTRGTTLCIPAEKNQVAGPSDFPFASTPTMEEGTVTPGDALVGADLAARPPLLAVRGSGYERTTADSPLPPAPPAVPAAPALFGTFPTSSLAPRASPSCYSAIAPLAAAETPVGKQQQQRQSSVGVAGDAATSTGGLFPTTSREPLSSAGSDSAEDEAAVEDLVGMGFDREHVVRALKECGRGESWKEAAISLLLEPQTSMMPESGPSGGGRHEAAGQE